MTSLIDLTGQRFGRLRVVERAPDNKHRQTMWRCLCDCGETVVTIPQPLKSGRTKSCGCLTTEQLKARITSHNKSRTPEYRIWAEMLQRCKFPEHERNRRYAGRGIAVCARWHDFANFYADMGPRPSPKHTLERRNSDGNYEPDNCSWEPRIVQNNNTSRNLFVVYKGQRMTLTQAQRLAGCSMKHTAVRDRIRRGWTVEEALETPARQVPPGRT